MPQIEFVDLQAIRDADISPSDKTLARMKAEGICLGRGREETFIWVSFDREKWWSHIDRKWSGHDYSENDTSLLVGEDRTIQQALENFPTSAPYPIVPLDPNASELKRLKEKNEHLGARVLELGKQVATLIESNETLKQLISDKEEDIKQVRAKEFEEYLKIEMIRKVLG